MNQNKNLGMQMQIIFLQGLKSNAHFLISRPSHFKTPAIDVVLSSSSNIPITSQLLFTNYKPLYLYSIAAIHSNPTTMIIIHVCKNMETIALHKFHGESKFKSHNMVLSFNLEPKGKPLTIVWL